MTGPFLRPKRLLFGAALLGATLLKPTLAEAAEQIAGARLELHSAPELVGCPSEATFASMVQAYLPRDRPLSANVLRGTILVRITPLAAGVTGVMDVSYHGAQPLRRELRAANCVEVAQGLALVVALSVDSNIVIGSRPAEPLPIIPDKPPKPEPKPEPPLFSWSLGAGSHAVIGILPTPTASLGTGTELELRRFPYPALRLDFGLLPFSRVTLPDGRVTYHAWELQASLCPANLRYAPATLGLCGGFGGLWIFSNSRGFGDDRPADTLLPGWTVGVRARLDLSQSASVRLANDLFVPTHATAWQIAGLGIVHETSPVAVRVGATLNVNVF